MRQRRGMTLIEILIVLAILGIAAAIMALNLRPLGGDVDGAARNLSGLVRQGRSKAMATTSSYNLVLPETSAGEQRFVFERGSTCQFAATVAWSEDHKLSFTLPPNVRLTAINGVSEADWPLCFNSRGVSRTAPALTLTDDRGSTRTLQIFAGGMVEIE